MLTKTLEDLLALLEADATPLSEEPSADDMAPWRNRIDALDRAILLMLNERAVCANAIGHIKKKLGMPVYVPSREQEVLRNVLTSNTGPLPDDAVKRLFERVIDETRSLERHLYQQKSAEPGPGLSE